MTRRGTCKGGAHIRLRLLNPGERGGGCGGMVEPAAAGRQLHTDRRSFFRIWEFFLIYELFLKKKMVLKI